MSLLMTLGCVWRSYRQASLFTALARAVPGVARRIHHYSRSSICERIARILSLCAWRATPPAAALLRAERMGPIDLTGGMDTNS